MRGDRDRALAKRAGSAARVGAQGEDLTLGLYDPKKALFAAFPRMRQLSHDANCVMEGAEVELSRRECRGCDTSWARTAHAEAEWRIGCTSDYDAASAAVARLQAALQRTDPPGALDQDADGSFAGSTGLLFLKLDNSTDQLLARQWRWRRRPSFLAELDDPVRLITYLQDLCWSDVKRCGRDNRKELNLAISVIARLVLKGGQAGYLVGPAFVPVFERFVREWQDRETGFFGMTYICDRGTVVKTCDLSLTFHMVRYAPHLVRWWPSLVDTLFAIKEQPYPQGWLEHGGMTDHNNYDVVEVLQRGWPHLRPDQRRRAGDEIAAMLDWCLYNSVAPNGELRHPDQGDPIPDSYYFAAAFLDTVGFFDRTKRFWTETDLTGPEPIRQGMIQALGRFNRDWTVIGDTLARLGRRRASSNAVL
jgi:hypothetical protein